MPQGCSGVVGLTMCFQPIFEVRGTAKRLHALECLARGAEGSRFRSAEVLFREVRRSGMEILTDRTCLRTALAESKKLPWLPNLCINIYAKTLAEDRELPAFLEAELAANNVSPHQVTLEIVEHGPDQTQRGMLKTLEILRATGIRIALDDVGLGASNLQMVLDCHPDYLKISRYFVQGCDHDERRGKLLHCLADLGHRLGCRTVAEGVERPEELEAVTALGIDLVQGYLLCPPLAGYELVLDGALLGMS